MKKLIFSFLLIILLLPISTQAAGTLPFYKICTDNKFCASNDCDTSDLNYNYCDCFSDSDCEAQYGAGNWECKNGDVTSYGLDYCVNTDTAVSKLTELYSSIERKGGDLGDYCDTDPDCMSSECEKSDFDASKNEFCVCDTAQHCADKYGGSAADWECNDGNTASHNINYCHNKTTSIDQYPIENKELFQVMEDQTVAQTRSYIPPVPKLVALGSVCPITQVAFAEGQQTSIPWIGQCVGGIYNYMVTVGSLMAILFIVIGGIIYIISGGSSQKASTAKSFITKSIYGLVILAVSYILLYNINPNLVQLNSIAINVIEAEDIEPIGTASGTLNTTGSSGTSGSNVPTTNSVCQKEPSEAAPGGWNTSLLGQIDCHTKTKRQLGDIQHIIIHEGGKSASSIVNYWKSQCDFDANGWCTSSHYYINRDGTVYQLLDETKKAYHTPKNWNASSIGIDLAINVPGDRSTKECLKCKITGSCKGYDKKPRTSSKVSTKEEAIEACLIYYTDAQYASLKRLVESITSRTGVTKDAEHVRTHCNTAANHGDPRNLNWQKLGLGFDGKSHSGCSFYPAEENMVKNLANQVWGS